MSSIFVINGPNLNLLGQREPEQYGNSTLDDVEALCHQTAKEHGVTIKFMQSNHEGVLIDWFHEAGIGVKNGSILGVVFNPGAFTHTSVALHDAIKGTQVPTIETHISNVHAREAFRNHSYISPVANGIIVGFGIQGYALAIKGLIHQTRG
ncbi:type II 3-dehydroquinate dehydratase [Vibrio penaeicida]|uniref:3-dehydroquinate dehydratase n=1 Tax=Vibrio penaeicida TaxID=104609 RepID=A0AAV5NWB8_9VIBR|nr:type II 3-dehydroquinate dehydratase [Vibrio penaeicida]MDP2574316.1 type II 3-dehydroquinate dehydratase [Vibrio penaeicida]RTZ24460.1 type II 3-dehydroquinate dehydratase [Vibrio penaeicida]GLQ74735.1 3-dehydroquinate dehydratase [Vibrio penaeicida]